MKQYALVDGNGVSVQTWTTLPGIIQIPGTLDRVMGAEPGWEHRDADDNLTGWKLIEQDVPDPPPPPPPPDPEPERRMVMKSVIITRLHAAGKLEAASAAINSNLYVRERWYAPDKPGIYFDDPEALALLASIGADAEEIMAP